MQLTADAIHNWDAPYIVRQYAHVADAVKAAAKAAFRRHHFYGADAQIEAEKINRAWNL